MSYSGEAADQVVRLSLNGVEVAAKLSGSAAKQLAIMIYAILKDQKKTKGKIRLTNMLRSGKELKVFAVKDGDLQKFCLWIFPCGIPVQRRCRIRAWQGNGFPHPACQARLNPAA